MSIYKYCMPDIAILLSAGVFILIPLLLGYVLMIMIVWNYFIMFWNWFLWKGMKDEKRYDYITITFKTKRW